MTSILENFEQSMGITSFDVNVDKIVDIENVKLSFEDDNLSFENDTYEEPTEESIKTLVEQSVESGKKAKKKLFLPREDYDRIVKWLHAVKDRIDSTQGVVLFNEIVNNLNERDIDKGEFYDKLRVLKDFIN